ncbi:pro-epidermal growth factor isoform X1 [Micropterus dolomieu]|uniref:pro-epidermal growth factor isoform X1 n=1 Tax=Micropterus dolomieu TaxID=147949 RepID=UPI001E8CBCC9|nr:pro-epidermal growth factor isoform X1 [Micropterus dolomieu]
MLAATFTAALIYFMVQSSGTLALGTACWDERLSRTERNSSCVASQPFLIFGHGKAIHRMDLDGKNQRRLVAGVGTSILLDFNFREESVYWADKHTGVIYKASMRGAHRRKLYSSDQDISGLAVDWIWNGVYWTSGEKGKIKRIDIYGKNERTLLRHLTQPSSITVDPTKRFLFWLSGGMTPSIQRSDMTGQEKTTLVKIAEQLNALSIDTEDKTLFWVQFGMQGESTIASCDYNGNALHIIDQPLRSQSLGISVFLEHLYYTDTASHVIKKVNKYTGGEPLNVNIKRMAKIPVDIKVVHVHNQPMEDSQSSFPGCDKQSGNCVNVCSSLAEQGTCQCNEGFALSKEGTYCEDVNECALWNHGCSLGCENIPGSYFCTCPKGYALLPDRKTCQEIIPCDGNITKCGNGCLTTDKGAVCVCPEGSLLKEDGQACTGCSSADRGGCSQLCIPVTPSRWQCGCLHGYQLHQDGKRCIAPGPPPYLLVANLVDVRQINPDGTGDQTLVEEPRGTIIALDYDPVWNNVYFANTRRQTIERVDLNGGSREVLVSDGLDSPEGLAIDWVHRRMYWTDTRQSTVDCSTLFGLNRETIVSKGLEKPRGIAVHPLAKKLFWTDIGAQPAVESASLEGKDRAVIVSTNLLTPSGLTIDFTEDRLFWCDQRRGMVETAALDGSDRQVLLENQVGRPFDLAVFEDSLWISDREHQQLRSVHKRTGKKLQRIHGNMVQPASIVVVHPLAKPGADICLHLNGGCAQVCESKLGFAHCSCLSRYILSADGKSCLPAVALNGTTDSGDSESTDLMSLNNKTFNDQSTPLTTPGLSIDKEGAKLDSDVGNGPTLFTDKMVSDQNECYSFRCGINAQCLLNAGSPTCQCLEGFTGDGQLCVDIDECKQGMHKCDKNAECQNTLGKYFCKCQAGYQGNGKICQELETTLPWVTTGSPADVTTRQQKSNSVESCPSTHESYCLYQGVCFYFPEMESYACNCVSGYMGERCQFSDLEWWEHQQAEERKRRNVVIAACLVVLISLLSIAACVTYCYGTRKFTQPSVDNVSETSMTDESMSETTSTSVPRFYMVVEKGAEGMVIPAMGCPRRAACPSCSSETADQPGLFPAEVLGTSSKHNRGYECSMVSAVAMETNQSTVHHSSPSLSSSHTCTSFKPPVLPQTPSPESATS